MTKAHHAVPEDDESQDDSTPPHPAPPKVYRTRTGELVGTATEAADTVAKWTPQSLVQIICVVLLSVLVAGFAAVLWVNQEASKGRDREMRELTAGQIRETNAREELRNLHCAAESEKMRMDNAKTRIDAAETLKIVLAAFQAEGEKGRLFQASENEKFRREVIAAIKGKDAP